MQGEGHAQIIERCQTSRGELVLQQRGENFEIISNGTFLMATYNGESERLLVRVALDTVPEPNRVLIGGLGVGFSLVETLRDERVECVDVFEIEPKIVEWNRTVFGNASSQALADARSQIHIADLVDWLSRPSQATYDVICLDIDNGSDWTVHNSNAHLYSEWGMQQLGCLLNADGAVTFWNARRDPDFEALLQRHFAKVHWVLVPHSVGEPDVIYVARWPRQERS